LGCPTTAVKLDIEARQVLDCRQRKGSTDDPARQSGMTRLHGLFSIQMRRLSQMLPNLQIKRPGKIPAVFSVTICVTAYSWMRTFAEAPYAPLKKLYMALRSNLTKKILNAVPPNTQKDQPFASATISNPSKVGTGYPNFVKTDSTSANVETSSV